MLGIHDPVSRADLGVTVTKVYFLLSNEEIASRIDITGIDVPIDI